MSLGPSAKGKEPHDSYISVQVDRSHSKADVARWQAASDDDVEASLREQFQNPKAKTIGYVEIGGQGMRLRATYNRDGETCHGSAFIGDSVVNFELLSNSAGDISREIDTFVNFVKSVRVEHQ